MPDEQMVIRHSTEITIGYMPLFQINKWIYATFSDLLLDICLSSQSKSGYFFYPKIQQKKAVPNSEYTSKLTSETSKVCQIWKGQMIRWPKALKKQQFNFL